jgi:hypothetical protein
VWKTNDSVYWNVLKCKVKNVKIDSLKEKEIDLTSYFSIPYAPSNTVHIEGASNIIYSSAGNNPQYYKNPYKLYTKSTLTLTKTDTTTITVNAGEEWSTLVNDIATPAKWKIRYYYLQDKADGTGKESKYYDGSYSATDQAYKFILNGSPMPATNADGSPNKLYRGTYFVPKLDKDNCLVVSNTYVEDNEIYPVVLAVHPSNENTVLWA